MTNRLFIAILIVSISLLLAIVTMSESFGFSANSINSTNCNNIKNTSGQTTKDLSLTELFSDIRGSVVDINALSFSHDNLYVNGTPSLLANGGSGTGFIIDTAGHVVTNFHVVNGSTDFTVTFPDGNTYPGTIIGEDPYSDLAVLQVNQSAWEQGEQIKPLAIGDSSSLQIGQPVVAVGSPAGAAKESLTAGIISQINASQSDLTGDYLRSNLIQHSALIWHGNSGGPLLNMKGQVVGVNELVILQPQFTAGEPLPGLGISIPSNTATKVVCQILKYGHPRQPWLGMAVENMNGRIAQEMGCTGYSPKGVVVLAVAHGGPANLAGIKGLLTNDEYVILSIDGKQVRQMSDLNNYIDSKSVGDNIVLTLFIKGGSHPITNINLKLGERPAPLTLNSSVQAGSSAEKIYHNFKPNTIVKNSGLKAKPGSNAPVSRIPSPVMHIQPQGFVGGGVIKGSLTYGAAQRELQQLQSTPHHN